MNTDDKIIKPIYWDAGKNCLMVLDQRKLPHSEEWLQIENIEQVEAAIKTLAVRGAPLLGIAAAYGVYIGVRQFDGALEKFIPLLDDIIARIAATRPTAVNLFSALRRAQEVGYLIRQLPLDKIKERILALGHRILSEETERSWAIARNGADMLYVNTSVLTHCNTGSLAAGGVGTAIGIVYEAHRRGYIKEVLVDETRPLLQGARLTAWELARWGVPYRILADAAAAYAMNKNIVNVVIVGADRIVRNGDTANKIGSYSLAVAAHKHQIPFFVAAPISTFDLSILEGAGITIEERDGREILECAGNRVAPDGASAFNPAFDIVPAELITAIITDRGIIHNPNKYRISDHISGAATLEFDLMP